MLVVEAVRSWNQSNKEGTSDVESDQGTYVKLQELTRQKIKVCRKEANRWVSARKVLRAGNSNVNAQSG